MPVSVPVTNQARLIARLRRRSATRRHPAGSAGARTRPRRRPSTARPRCRAGLPRRLHDPTHPLPSPDLPKRARPRCYTGSMFTATSLSGDRPQQYAQLADQARALLHGERDRIANAANLSALVYHALPRLNWVGFYFFDGSELVAGPSRGRPAGGRVRLDRGVCGAAARTRQARRVDDVQAFPGHIACDAASRSELVLPLVREGELLGVFDLDSPDPSRFDVIDQEGLESIARIYIESLS